MLFRVKNAERVAGLFVIAVFLAAGMLITFVAKHQEWFAALYEINAVFEHGNDVQPNTIVYIEGIEVGKVSKISFNEQNKVELVLSIKQRFDRQIRKDSYAAIKRPNLFGSPVMDITLGSPREPMLQEGDYIKVADVSEVSMKDLIYVSNNLVQVVKEFVNPFGPYQKVLKNVETITGRLEKSESSFWQMFADDGKFFKDSREILAGINEHMKTNNSIPIELSKRSELIVNLSDKLDKQTDVLFSVAQKMDIICDRLVKSEGMAGAMISDKELYYEMIRFMKDSKSLLNNLNQLSDELKLVIPKLPGLIDNASKGMKEMQDVMDSVKRLPFVRSAVKEVHSAPPIDIEGRIERKENQ
jgi:phospholipid/cholesterol/gamma-HCH transport system substrate-binding protein